MNETLNRRQALGRTAAGLASLFCFGRLEFPAARAAVTAAEDLHLAAAATFEFAIQKLCIPYGASDGAFKTGDELRAAGYEVSKLLKPWNAPPLFANAEVFARGSEVVIRFSESVSLALSKQTVALLRPFFAAHPNFDGDISKATNLEVVQYLLRPFTHTEMWLDE
jgi:hypothetical protein